MDCVLSQYQCLTLRHLELFTLLSSIWFDLELCCFRIHVVSYTLNFKSRPQQPEPSRDTSIVDGLKQQRREWGKQEGWSENRRKTRTLPPLNNEKAKMSNCSEPLKGREWKTEGRKTGLQQDDWSQQRCCRWRRTCHVLCLTIKAQSRPVRSTDRSQQLQLKDLDQKRNSRI